MTYLRAKIVLLQFILFTVGPLFYCKTHPSGWFFSPSSLEQTDRTKTDLAKLPSCRSNLQRQNSEPYLWEFLWFLYLQCECRRPSSGQRRRRHQSQHSWEGWNPALSKRREWENNKQTSNYNSNKRNIQQKVITSANFISLRVLYKKTELSHE